MTRLRIIVCSIFCIWSFVDVTSSTTVDVTSSTICQTNQNADPLIHGDSHNAVQNFLQAISDKGTFAVTGDTATGSCMLKIGDKRHRKGRLYRDKMWDLDCWEPSECTIVEDGMLFKLIPVTSSNSMHVMSRTVLLPLYQHETASYTFLPMVSQKKKNILFATAMLTGCSVFVAKPNNLNCNLVVIHTNFRSNDTSANGTDLNHLQAMAVIEEVQSTKSNCTYHIDRRWAVDYWKPAITAAMHDYGQNIYYYGHDNGASFLYGSYFGNSVGNRWEFCIKIARPNPPKPKCFQI